MTTKVNQDPIICCGQKVSQAINNNKKFYSTCKVCGLKTEGAFYKSNDDIEMKHLIRMKEGR